MSVEEQSLQALIGGFQQLLQMVVAAHNLARRNLSRAQQERILREESSALLKNDPRADAAWKRLPDQTREQLMAKEINRVLDELERSGPENTAQNRDLQQVVAPQAEHREEVVAPGVEAPEGEQPGSVLGWSDGVEDVAPPVIGVGEVQQAEEVVAPGVEAPEGEQPGSVLGWSDGVEDVAPPVIGVGEVQQAEEVVAPGVEAPEGEQPGSVLGWSDGVEDVAPPVIGVEELQQAEGAGQEPEFLQPAGDGQLASPVVIGGSVPAPSADRTTPIFNRLVAEGQGQAAAAQNPQLSADMQKVQDLQRGQPSATGAAQRREGAPAEMAHGGETDGARRWTSSKNHSGGHSRGD